MRTRLIAASLVIGLGLCGTLLLSPRGPAVSPGPAGEPTPKTETGDKEGLHTALQAYVAAYNKGDLESLMSYWSSEPELLDEVGKTTRGREAIAALFKKSFADHKGLSIQTTVQSLHFIKPDVALQDGSVTLTSPDGRADRGSYTSIWTKTEGKWLLTRLHDLPGEPAAPAASSYEELKQLEWLVGDWVSEGKDRSVAFSCKWSKSQSFLLVDLTVRLRDQEAITLTQIIGWDPLEQRVRSWVFDSHGGFGESWWTRAGNRWTVESAGVLADGRRASSNSTWTYADDNTWEWASIDREIDSKPMPDVKVQYVRPAGKK